jgi:hypothetical protein
MSVEQDREEVLRLHRQWYDANHGIDIPKMRPVFAAKGDDYLMYNLNAHPYYGLEEKTQLWAHYQKQIESAEPVRIKIDRVDVSGDMAYIACEGVLTMRMIGDEGTGASNIEAAAEPIPFRFRSTEVYKRDDGEGNPVWKMWHFHCSPLAPLDEQRPAFEDSYASRDGAL